MTYPYHSEHPLDNYLTSLREVGLPRLLEKYPFASHEDGCPRPDIDVLEPEQVELEIDNDYTVHVTLRCTGCSETEGRMVEPDDQW